MSFMNTTSDLADFERFFYDEISFRNNLFKKPNLKTVYVMQN